MLDYRVSGVVMVSGKRYVESELGFANGLRQMDRLVMAYRRLMLI